MDDPDCDRESLFNTYRQFGRINRMLSGWRQIYKTHIRPRYAGSTRPLTLLDIGFGGGDIPLSLARWAGNDQIGLDITAIETDQRAVDFAAELSVPANVTFAHCSSTDLLGRGARFDIVISNHLLHHLDETEMNRILQEARELSSELVLFNDLERSDLGYMLFNIFSRPLFQSSFITHDGLLSIKRSYTLQELQDRVPQEWDVQRLFPFRLLLKYDHMNSGAPS